MKYNLKISEKEALELFHSKVMTQKEDVLTNVHWQIQSAQEEMEDADLARIPFLRTLIEMLGRFEKKIDKTPLFDAPSDWWAFSFPSATWFSRWPMMARCPPSWAKPTPSTARR